MSETASHAPLPDPRTVASVDLIQEIVDMDASDPRHPDWLRHATLTDLVFPMIWAWARREPQEVRRLGSALGAQVPGQQAPHGELANRAAGYALLAAAFHERAGPSIPFEAIMRQEHFVDEFGDPHPLAHVEPKWINEPGPDAATPWPDMWSANQAFRAFHAIAGRIMDAPPADRPLWSAHEILSFYDAGLSDGINCFERLILKPKAWRELALAVEEASMRSALDAIAAPGLPHARTASL